VARIDDLLTDRFDALDPKPDDEASRATKQAWSQKVSEAAALAFSAELRERGLKDTLPADSESGAVEGAERRMSGGIGAKQVDVSWATQESGLVTATSVKTINFRDKRSGNFQKNLTNRRGDMLFESVTLHRRFPFSVLAGFLMLDKDAANDGTERRRSTFENAHSRLKLFSGRDDPAGRDEQYERLYIMLLDVRPGSSSFTTFGVGDDSTELQLDDVFRDLIELVATRNPDFYEAVDGDLRRV
jgi:hypothetical protein